VESKKETGNKSGESKIVGKGYIFSLKVKQ